MGSLVQFIKLGMAHWVADSPTLHQHSLVPRHSYGTPMDAWEEATCVRYSSFDVCTANEVLERALEGFLG